MSWVAVAIAAAGVVGAGATAYGAHQGKKAADQQRKQDKPLQDQQADMLKTLGPYGKDFLGQGQGNMGILQNYLRSMASGDRNTAMGAIAPEINAMGQQQQGAVAAQRNLSPRGGMAPSQSANLPFQLQGNINNLLFQQRPQAMAQLGQLGSNQASLGLSAMGQGAGLTNSMLQYGLDARNQQMNQGLAMGQGIGNMLQLGMQYYNSRPQSTQPAQTLPNNPYTYYGNLTPGKETAANQNTLGGGSTPTTNSYNAYNPTNPYGMKP